MIIFLRMWNSYDKKNLFMIQVREHCIFNVIILKFQESSQNPAESSADGTGGTGSTVELMEGAVKTESKKRTSKRLPFKKVKIARTEPIATCN